MNEIKWNCGDDDNNPIGLDSEITHSLRSIAEEEQGGDQQATRPGK